MAIKKEIEETEQNKDQAAVSVEDNAVETENKGNETEKSKDQKTVSVEDNATGLQMKVIKKESDETEKNKDQTPVSIEEKDDNKCEQRKDELGVVIENNPAVNDINSNKTKLSDKNKSTAEVVVIEEGAVCCPCGCFCLDKLLCFNFGLLTTQAGFIHLLKVVVGWYCRKCLKEHQDDKTVLKKYNAMLQVMDGIIPTTFLLLVCFLFSKKSALLVRRSIFDFIFNLMASVCLIFVFIIDFVKKISYFASLTNFSFIHEVTRGVLSVYATALILVILYVADTSRSFQYYMKTRHIRA